MGVEEGLLFSRSLTIVTLGPSGLAGPEGGGGGLAAGAGLGAPEPPAAAGAGVPALPALQRPCLKAMSGTLAAARRTAVALIPPLLGGFPAGGGIRLGSLHCDLKPKAPTLDIHFLLPLWSLPTRETGLEG